MSKKQVLVQPTGRFDYLVDKHGSVYLIDNESKFVKRTELTKRKLSRNKIAYLWSNTNATMHYSNKGFDVYDVEVDDTHTALQFKFKEHVFSAEKVVCSMCNKFEISKDNVKEQVRHGKSHYFNTYGMREAELTKFFVGVTA